MYVFKIYIWHDKHTMKRENADKKKSKQTYFFRSRVATENSINNKRPSNRVSSVFPTILHCHLCLSKIWKSYFVILQIFTKINKRYI